MRFHIFFILLISFVLANNESIGFEIELFKILCKKKPDLFSNPNKCTDDIEILKQLRASNRGIFMSLENNKNLYSYLQNSKDNWPDRFSNAPKNLNIPTLRIDNNFFKDKLTYNSVINSLSQKLSSLNNIENAKQWTDKILECRLKDMQDTAGNLLKNKKLNLSENTRTSLEKIKSFSIDNIDDLNEEINKLKSSKNEFKLNNRMLNYPDDGHFKLIRSLKNFSNSC